MLSPKQPQNDLKEIFSPFKKKEEKFEISEWIDFFGERYGWTLDETMSLPIPVFFALQEAIKKRSEREKKEKKR